MAEFQGWIASLSNGKHVIETVSKAGDITSWQKLLKHCKAKSLRITGLVLVRNKAIVTSLPHKQCDGYFQAYEAHMAVFSKKSFTQQGIGSIIGDQVFINWIIIEEEDPALPTKVFQEVRPLEGCRVHTTEQ